MWALILTVVFEGYNKGGVAMTALPVFATEKLCIDAGHAWSRQMESLNMLDKRAYLCVKTL